jgi:hypothetical protein
MQCNISYRIKKLRNDIPKSKKKKNQRKEKTAHQHFLGGKPEKNLFLLLFFFSDLQSIFLSEGFLQKMGLLRRKGVLNFPLYSSVIL